MKAVLISIHPKWCEKIFNGQKTIEVRKSRPKIDTPFKVYVYQTKHNGGKGCKVIGEFICDKVDAYTFSNYEAQYRINDVDLIKTCLNFPELIAYGKGKILYGWHISDLKIYDKPKEIADFYKPCPFNEDCDILCPHAEGEYHGDGISGDVEIIGCLNRITRPPQSWCYIEV